MRQSLARLLMVIACVAGATGTAGAATSLEFRVKAAFLYNFVKFVEWPPGAFAGPRAPYQICVLGTDPFGNDLDEAAGGKTVRDRSIAIRRITEPRHAGGCQVLYISDSERERLTDIVQQLADAPILTVADDADFTARGGCLRFYLAENRVRFEVNLAATDRARLKLSAQLLGLAKVIGRRNKG